MDAIRYNAPRRLLTIARGHPYERNAFANLFTGLDDFDVCHVEQPVAQRLLNPKTAREFDVILCYDMPGVDFTATAPPGQVLPDPLFQENYLAMLRAGIGMVYMHHALAAWPSWPAYADILGGRFHYAAATLHGRDWPDSGYRHGVTHRVRRVGNHPVTKGIPDSFDMTDELYLCPIFEEHIVPLLRSDYRFEESNFYSAGLAVAGRINDRQGWSHPIGSNLVGWVKSHGSSPIVYLQGGDDPEALGNTHFKRLVHNAVHWVCSTQAHSWARKRPPAHA
ncbi:MAG: ThuA domain-containing protein [Halioglobus sp.]|nr:ThuA domain-containing protein [Halioglobus sp.]